MWKYGLTYERVRYDSFSPNTMIWRYEYASKDSSLNNVINLAIL